MCLWASPVAAEQGRISASVIEATPERAVAEGDVTLQWSGHRFLAERLVVEEGLDEESSARSVGSGAAERARSPQQADAEARLAPQRPKHGVSAITAGVRYNLIATFGDPKVADAA